MNRLMCGLAAGLFFIAVGAQAAPTWSTVVWNEVTVGGGASYYTDKHYHDDPTDNASTPPAPAVVDILGDATYPTAYWSIDNDNIMFRVRVDGNPNIADQYVWSALLNTVGDVTTDYVLQLDLGNDNQVEMATATGGSPLDGVPAGDTPWSEVAMPDTVAAPHVPPTEGLAPDYDPTDWYNYELSDSDFGGADGDAGPSADYFIDFAMDLDTFYAVTGLADGQNFQVAFASSANHENSNKDLPDGGWSDVITVPEPTALALLAIGCAVLGFRRRKV